MLQCGLSIIVGLLTVNSTDVYLEIAHSYGSDLTRVYPFQAYIGGYTVGFSCASATLCTAQSADGLNFDYLIDDLRIARYYKADQLTETPYADFTAVIRGYKVIYHMPVIKKYLRKSSSTNGNVTIKIPAGDNMTVYLDYSYTVEKSLQAYLGSFRLYQQDFKYYFTLQVYNTVRDEVLKWDYYNSVQKEAQKGAESSLYFVAYENLCSTKYELNSKNSTIPCSDIHAYVNKLIVQSDAEKPEKGKISITQVVAIIALVLLAFFIVCIPISCARDNRREAQINRPIIRGFGVNNAIKVFDQNLKQLVNASLVGFFGKDIALDVAPAIKRYKSIAIVHEADWWRHKTALQNSTHESDDEPKFNNWRYRNFVNMKDYELPLTADQEPFTSQNDYQTQESNYFSSAATLDKLNYPSASLPGSAFVGTSVPAMDDEVAQLMALQELMNDELPPMSEHDEDVAENIPPPVDAATERTNDSHLSSAEEVQLDGFYNGDQLEKAKSVCEDVEQQPQLYHDGYEIALNDEIADKPDDECAEDYYEALGPDTSVQYLTDQDAIEIEYEQANPDEIVADIAYCVDQDINQPVPAELDNAGNEEAVLSQHEASQALSNDSAESHHSERPDSVQDVSSRGLDYRSVHSDEQ